MPDSVTAFAILPGFPKPEVCGPHFDALKSYVASQGQPRPVPIDRAGVVWAERTLVNICIELGIEVKTRLVDDGRAAAVQELASRELTVLEWADLVAAVSADPSTMFVLPGATKTAQAVSAWFHRMLGRERGFSQSQVEQYLRLARASAKERAAVANAASLGAAMRLLRTMGRVKAPQAAFAPEASLAEKRAMQVATSLMESLGEVPQWTREGTEIIRGLYKVLRMTLRDCPAIDSKGGHPMP